MKMREQWETIERTEPTVEFLAYLYDRWQDEWEYEDLNDYLEAIKRHIPEAYEMTESPFGFKTKCDDGILAVWIYDDGMHLEICCQVEKGGE